MNNKETILEQDSESKQIAYISDSIVKIVDYELEGDIWVDVATLCIEKDKFMKIADFIGEDKCLKRNVVV